MVAVCKVLLACVPVTPAAAAASVAAAPVVTTILVSSLPWDAGLDSSDEIGTNGSPNK